MPRAKPEPKGLIDLGWFGGICPECGGPEGHCGCGAIGDSGGFDEPFLPPDPRALGALLAPLKTLPDEEDD